jgi:methylmalonyl-CoA mutase cobalamin-binding domain/chain
VAHRLLRLGVSPGDRVAVLAADPLDGLAGILAALKAGAAYVPLDPAAPPARLAELLADRGIDDVALFAGGEIPDAEVRRLGELGVGRFVAPGAPAAEIVDWIRACAAAAS